MTPDVSSLVDREGRQRVVRHLVSANQRLWDSWVQDDVSGVWSGGHSAYTAHPVALADVTFDAGDPWREAFLALITGAFEMPAGQDRGLTLSPTLLEPDAFVASFLPEASMREDDRRFFVCAALRARGEIVWSPELRRTFQHLAGATNGKGRGLLPFRELEQQLSELCLAGVRASDHAAYVALYLNALRHLRILAPSSRRGAVRIVSDEVDPEFIISSLFGVSTGIPGLDQLFGGSGPILPEAASSSSGALPSRDLMRSPCLPGRLILIRGQFGTGKSLLACHLAASVARKGGIANIAAVEQEPTEYLYMLAAMGLMPNRPGFLVEFGLDDATDLVTSPSKSGEGALLYTRARREQLEDGFMAMITLASRMSQYRLRLLVVDSLNGLTNLRSEESEDERGALQRAFRKITAMGVHLVLIDEENDSKGTPPIEDDFLADTVIRLSVASASTYYKRTVQITKCRFQREQRGVHHFSIASGKGINVIPSTAAVRTRVARRRPRSADNPSQELALGVPHVDEILGTRLARGQTLVLEGRAGTTKSAIAEAFLAAAGVKEAAAAISVGEPREAPPQFKSAGGRVVRRFINRGYPSPGVLFQVLDQLVASHFRGFAGVGRLAIDDFAAFDLDSPLVAKDASFGPVLMDYLRRQDVVSVLVMRSIEPGEPDAVRRAIVNDADFHIRLARRAGERGGRALLTVLKSPGMGHRSGWFDVNREARQIKISSVPAFINVQGDEEHVVGVGLFLFADAQHQARYNSHVAAVLRSNPGLSVKLVPQQRIWGPGAFRMKERASYRDVRIVQLDEFQLPDASAESGLLYPFRTSEISPRNRGFLKRIWERTLAHGGRGDAAEAEPTSDSPAGADRLRHAVPFYCNVGFLVCRGGLVGLTQALARARTPDEVEEDGATVAWRALGLLVERGEKQLIAELDWRLLAALSDALEKHHGNPQVIDALAACGLSDADRKHPTLFQHTAWTDENYNVMFLELLLWLRARDRVQTPQCELESWLETPQGLEAARLFRRLCRPAYLGSGGSDEATEGYRESRVPEYRFAIRRPRTNAIVWRQWFTTLAQLAEQLPKDTLRQMTVRELPGSCSIAGEWYLGVMADSALPEAGLHLVNTLVTPEAELERLRKGIGLPTRAYFYTAERNDGVASANLWVAPHLSLSMNRRKLMEILENAFRRSQFPNYAAKASSLSFALRSILEFEPTAERGSRDAEAEVDRFLRASLSDVVLRSRSLGDLSTPPVTNA